MTTLGFIGLGVMGAPMCKNMGTKHAGEVIAFDLSAAAREALGADRVRLASDIADVWERADVVFMSLPGASQVEAVILGPGGLCDRRRKPSVVVDLSTTSVAMAKRVFSALERVGVAFADAPVARTREAAQKGELSIMVGASADLFERIKQWLGYIGSDITHTGSVGSGQFAKLVNNALLDVSVVAIAEAIVLAEKAGFDPAVVVDAVSKGSGDSYALRNHTVKSLLPRNYPAKSFPPAYKIKDLTYLQELGSELHSPLQSIELALAYFREAIQLGYGERYFPVIREVIERRAGRETV